MKVLKKALALVLLSSLLFCYGISAAPTTQANAGTQSNVTVNQLAEIANKQQVNILLYDETGHIDQEFHSDGLKVKYNYKNGKINDSIDDKGYKQEYVDNGEYIEVTEYKDNKKNQVKEFAINKNLLKLSQDDLKQIAKEKMEQTKNASEQISIQSLTVPESYMVNGVDMTSITHDMPQYSSGQFYTSTFSMTESVIQSFFTNKNSILKDNVQIWRKNSSGTVYNTGTSINPAHAIWNAADTYMINPKVIIATLQKESSLVSASPGSVSYSSRRFYYAMGYGATDGGDINGTSGFDVQIDKGTRLLRDLWMQSPTGYWNYPSLITGINYNKTVTSNGVTYKNYIWVKDYGTWALYKYTPHALDVNLLPTIGGGNYLFYSIFKGYWGTNWD
ncbi:hypothetical protein [Desulfosporosinus sp. OT]|uniref:hypothetical protein n=1 Tax=Desulfosporosinus sp. OT TaxID=913865 RepID=UPI000223B2E8|nr:hypothetical protein [Desulfosporosinus sp. OT]EGW36053.1 hypothetical protein DOT_6061 [Desulfosporosinus sp. OT]